jgi:hypothetical protein
VFQSHPGISVRKLIHDGCSSEWVDFYKNNDPPVLLFYKKIDVSYRERKVKWKSALNQ